MKISQNFPNALFKRQELIVTITSDKNPSFEEMKKQISEKTKKPVENIEIASVKGGFGKNSFNITSYVYESIVDLENMKKLQMTKKQRKDLAKAAKEAKKTEAENKDKPADEQSMENKPATESALEQTEQKAQEQVQSTEQSTEELKTTEKPAA